MTFATFALFAAEAADPISGGAGWLGAGLLGMVLAWLLLKHLPAKDEQIERLIRTKDQAVKEIADAAAAAGREMRAEFRASLELITAHCERENRRSSELVQEGYDKLVAAIDELRVFLGIRAKPPDRKPRGEP